MSAAPGPLTPTISRRDAAQSRRFTPSVTVRMSSDSSCTIRIVSRIQTARCPPVTMTVFVSLGKIAIVAATIVPASRMANHPEGFVAVMAFYKTPRATELFVTTISRHKI